MAANETAGARGATLTGGGILLACCCFMLRYLCGGVMVTAGGH